MPRLFFLGKEGAGDPRHQNFAQSLLLKHAQIVPGTRLGVWPELKMRYQEGELQSRKLFDYTFDYVLMPLSSVSSDVAELVSDIPWETLRPILIGAGYTLSQRDGKEFIEDFPSGSPIIVEVMTSSTSGGNKTKRTTIPMAFEDAILGREHNAPSINYRQVWARMVSQLIVKSEVAMSWGARHFGYCRTPSSITSHHPLD